ncbi:MAG: T9SS type A sorting domain-containing protein [Flavobacteriales bacterium]|nr:T9SS type A sorting domain-containing protein [Flavobacteriales bacterium]
MKRLLTAALWMLSLGVFGQSLSVELEPITIADMYGAHSFATAIDDDGRWLIIGGRVDGLHRRQPFAAFLEEDNHKNVLVVDINNNSFHTAALDVLPTPLFEQLQSTNPNFHQRENTLYFVGGYGYSATVDDHITYPNVTAISVNELCEAVVNGEDITPFFRQITFEDLAVTGGQMGYIEGTFYLMGGQYFEGRYNPMGPDMGPGFIQEYTDAVYRFEIEDDGTEMAVVNFQETVDTPVLHRRDYVAAPQIFPDGTKGFTMFSGVFQIDQDIPWLTSVDVLSNSHAENTAFQQYLNHYHCAKIPVFFEQSNTMATLFFGGMSRYYYDDEGVLIDDVNGPFVKSIGLVERYSDGTMTEYWIGNMPGFLGSGAEFMLNPDLNFDNNGLLTLPGDIAEPILAGYIIGGIECGQENIFFINDGTQSAAHTTIYEVWLSQGVTNVESLAVEDQNLLQLSVFPNPTQGALTVSYFCPTARTTATVEIVAENGALVKSYEVNNAMSGYVDIDIDTDSLATGSYVINLTVGDHTGQTRFIRKAN